MAQTRPQYRDLFSRRWRQVPDRPRKEDAFQIQLVSLFHWCVRPDIMWRHIPNGGLRDPRTAAKMKAMGQLPGSADLEFHWFNFDEHGQKRPAVLHMELKVGNRPQSEAQAAFALKVRLLGHEYFVVRSQDEALEILRERGLLRRDVTIHKRP